MEFMPRRRIAITIDEKLVEWIERQVTAKRFWSKSHAVESILSEYVEKERAEKE